MWVSSWAMVIGPRSELVQMAAGQVADLEASLVAQAHDLDRDERLADRAESVLRVGVGNRPTGSAVEGAGSVGPDQLAIADDACHQRRQSALRLLGGEPV